MFVFLFSNKRFKVPILFYFIDVIFKKKKNKYKFESIHLNSYVCQLSWLQTHFV